MQKLNFGLGYILSHFSLPGLFYFNKIKYINLESFEKLDNFKNKNLFLIWRKNRWVKGTTTKEAAR